MAVIEMNTITQDAVIKLAEAQEALSTLADLLDKSDHIGLAVILLELVGRINNGVMPYIIPVKEEAKGAAE